MKYGIVSIIGRPNVGKSTLINSLLNKKVSIISNKPQTTRNNIEGVYEDKDTKIIFVDTPGIHKPKYKLGNILNSKAYISMEDVDLILMVVDVTEDLGKGDKYLINKLTDIPTILVLNKIDLVKKDELLPKIDEYSKLYNFSHIVPISAYKKDNIEELLKTIKEFITSDEELFVQDKDENFYISELVREKVLHLTKEEIPHTVTCIIEEFEEKKNIINIGASIIVDRENIKKIIIGKNGSMIKEIGTRARIEIEEYYKKKVFLNLNVKVIKDWRDKEKYLVELGLKDR
ncbi:MAG: GTPase Era [Tenericutes bacterium]|nr:GTPase Era [Bacilli bacterium]MDD4831704.1 GTPase Era [Bacilli bacterium]NLV89869.1 GTPase Era [Mycoplasmatota bacterium]